LLLLIAVLVPTACVLWFMSRAVRNERLAVRQELMNVYRAQLDGIQGEVEAFWDQLVAEVGALVGSRPCAALFAEAIERGLADSIICYGSPGRVGYPAPPRPPADSIADRSPAWREAERLEQTGGDPAAAAHAYGLIAQQVEDTRLAAIALQAQVRCLIKSDQTDAAVQVLTKTLLEEKYRHASDARGRLIVPNAMLLALQLIGDPADPVFCRMADALRARLSDYGDMTLPGSQRRFLMGQLISLLPQGATFATLEAEKVAADYLETDPTPAQETVLVASDLPGVWRMSMQAGTVVALFREAAVLAGMNDLIGGHPLPTGASVELLPPGENRATEMLFASIPAADHLPGWRLVLNLEDPSPFDSAAEEQIALYVWTGGLVILTIMIMTALVARYVGRQMRLTRLKNDLVATVTHELKTPLSSMRMLVDTLLDGQYENKERTREYLGLIAKENTRLSRLIDNFLAFSRMERNKRSFDFAEVKPGDILAATLEAVGDKFEAADFRLETDIPPDLPAIVADADAIVSVLLNLLDNAYKYSDENRHVTVRAYHEDGSVCFEVEDHGIGLSRRSAKRVFDRFYRVDQSLSRKAEGCGLGLNIVRFVTTSHGGSVSVRSQLGRGSTFTVRLPVAGTEASRKLQRTPG
jgi:signal transduction histidine kinase